ncbi:MAG: hypothetical protein MZV64_28385 [Ignavibacteriales bacterium]|nr:hypothetical protein [Ignavibacteriales bacterium]
MPVVGSAYSSWAGPGTLGVVLRALAARRLPAPADAADGRHAAGALALDRDDAARRLLARVLLRRQHGRRGHRQPAGRLLPAPRLRPHDGHVRGRRR